MLSSPSFEIYNGTFPLFIVWLCKNPALFY
jgi:hypothetical protein